MYDERAENTYNTANRTMTGNLGNWLLDNYETVGTVSPDQQQRYSDIADTSIAASWDDFNRQLAKGQAAANARAYNRFGSLTNTPALYDQETFARQANAGATDLGSTTAQYMNSLVNQDINRQLQAWQQYSNMYNKAGEDITKLDKYNWNIRNQNKDRAYTNDVSKFQAKVAKAQALADMVDPSNKMMERFGNFLGNKISANADKGMANMMSQANNLQGFSMPSSIADKYSYFNNPSSSLSIFGNSGGNTFASDIAANFGSSGASDGGSWLSSIGSWFKGLGGK